MSKKDEFIKILSEEKKALLLKHFNSIYVKKHKKFTKDELSIVYLAWLWKKGLVTI